jgi:hypothetical protein
VLVQDRALSPELGRGLGAVGVERAGEFLSDGRCGRGFDGRALHEIDELAVAEDGDGGRGGRMTLEVAAGALGGFAVLAGEDGNGLIGRGGVLEGEANAGTHLAGGATTDGVDDEKGGSGLGEGGIDLSGGAGFEDACLGELFTHGDDHQLWIHRCCLLCFVVLG